MDIPAVRYLHTDRGAIAYQRFGQGDRTIVWTSPPTISIETRWWRPGDLQRWGSLASLGTVVIFDYRGTGASERLPLERVGQLDELCFDLDAVVTQLASPPTVLIATTWATVPALAYTAGNAGHLERMVLLNAATRHPIYDAPDPDEAIATMVDGWGTGEVMARAVNIELEASQKWIAGQSERIVGTPSVAGALFRNLLHHEAVPWFPKVTLPTLVIHTGDIARITPQQTEAVASAIPGATYLLRPSSFFNWGEWDSDIHEFITGTRPATEAARDLATIVFTDIVDSSKTASERGDTVWRATLERLDGIVTRAVGDRGRVVKQTGDGHLIEFARPGDAIAAASRLVDDVRLLGVDLRVGIHFGEVERREGGDIGGIAVHLAARIAGEATAHEILVSRTVAELTMGDGRTYTSRGTRTLKGIPGEWPILALNRDGPE